MQSRWTEVRAISPIGLMVLAVLITLFLNVSLLVCGLIFGVVEKPAAATVTLVVVLPLLTGFAFGLCAALYNVCAARFGGLRVVLSEGEARASPQQDAGGGAAAPAAEAGAEGAGSPEL